MVGTFLGLLPITDFRTEPAAHQSGGFRVSGSQPDKQKAPHVSRGL